MKKILVLFLLASFISLHANWEDQISLNGYFNFEFENRVAGDEDVSRADEHASFDSDMIDIVLNIQATDNLRVAVDFTWEHGSQSEVGKGNVGYEYAFAEYTFSDSFKVRTGKMFTPFGIYNEIHTAKPSIMIVKEPNATNKMYFISSDKYEQTLLYPRWGTGIAFLGNYEVANMPFDYILQMTNGDVSYGVDSNEYDKDDNGVKAITGRIRANITNNLEVGASFYHDKMTRYDKQYKTKVVTDSSGNSVNYVSKKYVPSGVMNVDSQGAQMIWHVTDRIRLEAEYMSGRLNVEGITSFRRSGYTILPSYSITEDINIFFLYAKADPNHDIDENSVVNYAPGINMEVARNAFVKLDLFNVQSEKANALYRGKHYSEIRAAFAIGF